MYVCAALLVVVFVCAPIEPYGESLTTSTSYDVKWSEGKSDQRKEGIPLSCLLVYDSLSLLVDEAI